MPVAATGGMRDFTAAHVWDGIRFSRGDVQILVRSRVSPPRRALDCLDVEAARALGPVPIQREARRVVTAEGEYGALLHRTLANPNLPTPGTPLPAPAPAAAPVHPPTHALEASAHAAHVLARPSQGHEPTPTGGSH